MTHSFKSQTGLVALEEGGADAQRAAVSVAAAATNVTVIAWLVPSQPPGLRLGLC